MRLSEAECRKRVARSRVGRLATVGGDGRPHLVPVTFALAGGHLLTAVDRKPKSTTRLRRLRNIAENPQVSVLLDHYEDDWTKLWWVRADGTAAIATDETSVRAAAAALAEKYPQYRESPPDGPVIDIAVASWTGWAY